MHAPRRRPGVRGGAWHHRAVLAYRHAFHAGNHADVLKHLVLMRVLQQLSAKDKGWRCIDTHAGAGGYSLLGDYASQRAEFEHGIGRLWALREPPSPLVADYVALVRRFNGDAGDMARPPKVPLAQYPGSPAVALAAMRPQDDLRATELHPTEHKILQSYLGSEPGVELRLADGFATLKAFLPPPTRRGVVLIDPSYEVKSDYPRVLSALREALALFPQAVVLIWLPLLQLVEATQLPPRLKSAADSAAARGWLHARLHVARAGERGFGLMGSSIFVANPPHGLHEDLQTLLPWLATTLSQFDGARGVVERSVAQ